MRGAGEGFYLNPGSNISDLLLAPKRNQYIRFTRNQI
jgi:hypothetical protein